MDQKAHLDVKVFDPTMPFLKISAASPGFSTWHDGLLVIEELRSKMPLLDVVGEGHLEVPGGITIQVPKVRIGLQVGTVMITSIEALVVPSAYHDVVLGEGLIATLLSGQRDAPSPDCSKVSVGSPWKDDPSALSIELYPVEQPFPVRNLEAFLRGLRGIHNVAAICVEPWLQAAGFGLLATGDDSDADLPGAGQLLVSAVDSGSVWLSFKSGSMGALKYLASLFKMGATARLAQEMADSSRAEIEAGIARDTRQVVAARVQAENEALRAENIHRTYESFRKETRARLDFLDELIREASLDDATRAVLIRRKNQAILEIAEQGMVPMVRNVPGSMFSDGSNSRLVLPPPRG